MSKLHPIIAVTGSSGADLSTVRHAFKDVFRRLGIRPALLKRIPKSRMTRPTTMLVPGGKLKLALEVIYPACFRR